MFNSKIISLESYLAQIERELHALPASARAEEMREIEAHLHTMIEARGDVAAVFRQFGQPRKVGRDLRRAWERKQLEAWWRVILAPMSALIFQIFAVFLLGFFLNIDKGYALDDQIQGIFSHSAAGLIYLSLLVFYCLSFYLISGLVVGVVSPKRGKWSVAAYFLFILLFISSAYFGRAISAYDNASGDSISIIWSIVGVHVSSTLLCFYGAHIGAHYGRKRIAKSS